MTLLARLSRLERDGLIEMAHAHPELEYLFRHGLIKDAAYFGLLKGDRRALHRAVGEALEQAADPTRDRLPALAVHFSEAGEGARALRYSTLAGDAAAAAYANAEAIAHYTRALGWAVEAACPPEQVQHLHLALGRAQELSGDYPAALATYQALQAAGQARQAPALVLSALTRRVVAHSVPSPSYDAAAAERLTAEALPLAESLGDCAAEARLRWAEMLTTHTLGRVAEALRSGEQALELARAAGDRDLLATVLQDLSRIHMSWGTPARAETLLAEALELWRALHNVPMLAETTTTLGGLAFFRGRYAEALELLRASQALSQSIGNAWGIAYSLMYQSYLLLDRGDFGAALAAVRGCLEHGERGGFFYPQAGVQPVLGVILTYLGQDAEAEAALDRAYSACERFVPAEIAGVHAMRAWRRLLLHDFAGAAEGAAAARTTLNPDDHLTATPYILTMVEVELELFAGRPAAALEGVRQRLTLEGHIGTQAFITDLHRLEGVALLALGDPATAETVLLAAHAQATAQPSHRALWTIALALARTAAARGDAAGAAQWQAIAAHQRDYLAAHIDDPAQRAAFLARADQLALTH